RPVFGDNCTCAARGSGRSRRTTGRVPSQHTGGGLMTTVSAAVAEVVAEHTTEVFALMGNGNAHVTDALARHGSTTITAVRHEAATVASADAYHRISRRPAVATTTYGPGFTNAL